LVASAIATHTNGAISAGSMAVSTGSDVGGIIASGSKNGFTPATVTTSASLGNIVALRGGSFGAAAAGVFGGLLL
jgi:hypothetical protein